MSAPTTRLLLCLVALACGCTTLRVRSGDAGSATNTQPGTDLVSDAGSGKTPSSSSGSGSVADGGGGGRAGAESHAAGTTAAAGVGVAAVIGGRTPSGGAGSGAEAAAGSGGQSAGAAAAPTASAAYSCMPTLVHEIPGVMVKVQCQTELELGGAVIKYIALPTQDRSHVARRFTELAISAMVSTKRLRIGLAARNAVESDGCPADQCRTIEEFGLTL